MPYIVTDKSTQFGAFTPHSLKTPHKLPTDGDESKTTLFLGLTRQLYPTGRAFNIPENGVFEALHRALNKSLIGLVEDAKSIIDASLPDNENFTEEDAQYLEFKLGLFENNDIDLESRKSAILRKMAYPSNIRARQHPLFIQTQLRLAGFDVFVYENKFMEGGQYVYRSPDEVAAVSVTNTQHGGDLQHGPNTLHGSTSFQVIANSSEPNEVYAVGGEDNLWATFFIAGDTISSMATIEAGREKEFRELVLKLKPAHTVAYLFINFN